MLCSGHLGMKALVQHAVKFQHKSGAGKQFFKGNQFWQGQHVAAVAAANCYYFKIRTAVCTDSHLIQVYTINSLLEPQESFHFQHRVFSGKVQP